MSARLLKSLFVVLAFVILMFSSPVTAGEKVILVLDGSGSMWARIQGTPKIQIARNVINSILKDWKPENQIGLVVYGHRRKGDCNDIETLVPVGKLDKPAFMRAVNDINPKGKTPLSKAVLQAAERLKYTEDKATVILVSDGRETCNADPCGIARQLKKTGVDFTLHVVGFDVSDKQGVKQLQCMAKATGGLFLSANDATALKKALGKVVKKVQAKNNLRVSALLRAGGPKAERAWFRVFREERDANGKVRRIQVASSGYGSERAFKLPPGDYLVEANQDKARAEARVRVVADKVTRKEVILNAGRVRLYSILEKGGKPAGRAWFYLFREEKGNFGKTKRIQVASSGYGPERSFTVPAGDYIAVATLGRARAEVPIRVKPGEKLQQAIYLGAGRVRLVSILQAGGKPAGRAWFYLYREEKDSLGKTKRVQVASSGYGSQRTFTVPAGDYIAVATLGGARAEAPVRVEANKLVETKINLNAGQVRLVSILQAGGKPAGRAWFYLYREEKDNFGKIKRVRVASDGYGSQRTFTVPAGDYIAVASLGSAKAETPVKVEANKLVEAKINLNAGQVRLVSILQAGGKPAGRAWFYLYREEKDNFGKIKRVRVASDGYGSQRTFTVPAGEYIAVASLGSAKAEAPVKVEANKLVEAKINLNAGQVKAVTGVKGSWFYVYREARDDKGNIRQVRVASGGYGAQRSFIVPAGEYVVKATRNGLGGTARVTVKAGQGVEARIDLKRKP